MEFAATGVALHALMHDVAELKKEADDVKEDVGKGRAELENELVEAEIIATNR